MSRIRVGFLLAFTLRTHIVEAALSQAAVANTGREVRAPERWNGSRELESTRHVHIQSCVGCMVAGMSGHPIRYNVALEAKLFFQYTVQDLAVLAAVRLIHTIVGALAVVRLDLDIQLGMFTYHNGSSAAFDSIGKWPQVELVKGSVIDVGADRFDGVVVWAGGWIALSFLLCEKYISIDS